LYQNCRQSGSHLCSKRLSPNKEATSTNHSSRAQKAQKGGRYIHEDISSSDASFFSAHDLVSSERETFSLPLVLEKGFTAFILMDDDSRVIEVWGGEVAPALREAITRERGSS
jgi:hypothetical protein